jgi:hypothetical protein
MKMSTIAMVFSCSLLLLPMSWTPAQPATTNLDTLKSVRDFVNEFYSWYVSKEPYDYPLEQALKFRSHAFSPELFKALKDDVDAQAKATLIVGLDFDPFLATNGRVWKSHELRGATQTGKAYRVEVFGVYPDSVSERPEVPDVVAEVSLSNEHWVFTNFLYPQSAKQFPRSANLLAILKLLKEERRKYEERGRAISR